MNPVGSLLFLRADRTSLRVWLDFRGNQEIRKAVDALADSVFGTQTDDELAIKIGKDLAVPQIRLEIERAERDVAETRMTVEDPFGRGSTQRAGLRAVKRIPFTGDPELWHLHPSAYTSQLPQGRISGGYLIVGVELQENEVDGAPAYLDRQIAAVRLYLDNQAADIASFNDSLPSRIRPLLQQRRIRLAKAADLLKRL
jgi:hypothetical protein